MTGNGRENMLHSVLNDAQEYISRTFSGILAETKEADVFDEAELRPYIDKYLKDNKTDIPGMTREELTDRLYSEMAEYSILTKYLKDKSLEEIDVNGWDDICIIDRTGIKKKIPEKFFSPQHAEDIVKRLLQHSGMIIDNATPMSQGHLPGNNRITALKAPLIDPDRGIAVSIRILHNDTVTLDELIKSGSATEEMLLFLQMLSRYGISFVIAGATSSGKTTLLNAVLDTVPDDKRIFTIESGARELSLVRRNDNGIITNNVVHTISRPSDNPRQDIKQEDLVVASLRYNPDIVVVGEMRDVECYAAIEAAQTGHTVLSTVHAGAGEAAHMRIALLSQKRFPIEFRTSMLQAAQAFPVVVYMAQLEDHSRRIMDITECVSDAGTGGRSYRSLYSFELFENCENESDGKTKCIGTFIKHSGISHQLKKRLIEHGAPSGLIRKFVN